MTVAKLKCKTQKTSQHNISLFLEGIVLEDIEEADEMVFALLWFEQEGSYLPGLFILVISYRHNL